jgi:RimJ/RimL family protein N-acetyltransferase
MESHVVTEIPFAAEPNSDAVNSLPSGLVPARQVMTGKQVVLEPLDAGRHAFDLYHASHNTDAGLDVWTYLPEGPWPDVKSFTRHIEASAASLDRVFYAIRPRDGDAMLGQASLMDIQPLSGVIEVGYIWFAPRLQRTRAATEALFLMLNYAMTELRYRRMQWRCNAHNEKSRSAAKRLGFRYEGTFYNHMIYKGLNRDTAWYSILDSEWDEVRNNFRLWLDDANFDAEGRAQRSLRSLMDARTSQRR